MDVRLVSGSSYSVSAEIVSQISAGGHWAKIVPTGSDIADNGVVGVFVSEDLLALNTAVTELKSQLVRNAEELDKHKKETKSTLAALQEQTTAMAALVAKHDQLLVKHGLLSREYDKILQAHDVLTNCVLCLERVRETRFSHCGHVACCDFCARNVFDSADVTSRVCPICRAPIVNLSRIYLS